MHVIAEAVADRVAFANVARACCERAPSAARVTAIDARAYCWANRRTRQTRMRAIQPWVIGAALAVVWATSVVGGTHSAPAAVPDHTPAAPSSVHVTASIRPSRASPPAVAGAAKLERASTAQRDAREIPDELEAEREAQLFQAYFGRLDAMREREGLDRELEQQVQRALHASAERLPGLRIEQIACGRTLCRVNAKHDDLYARRLYLAALYHSVGPLLPEASIFVPPTGSKTEAYFARAGHSLPER
jgi:hypothetical protein